MSQSSELAGGAGFIYEVDVALHYLTKLLVQKPGIGMDGRIVTRVALQQRSYGERLDDLVVDGKFEYDKKPARFRFQTKSSVRISAASSNTDFRKIVTDCWNTLNEPDFTRDVDRFGFVVYDINDMGLRNLHYLCELARSHGLEQFTKAFDVGGLVSNDRRAIKDIIATLLTEDSKASSWEELHYFLRHFLCIRLDYPDETSRTIAEVIGDLQDVFFPEERNKAPLLMYTLCDILRKGGVYAAEFDRTSLLLKLSGRFCFASNKPIENAKQQEANTGTNIVYPQILAMPFGPEFDRRRAWPENLLMRIGVDRTRLLGVVAGIEAQVLYDALRYTEELVAVSDLAGRFGKRQWFCVETEWPRLDNEKTAIGFVWNIPNDVSMDQIKEAIRSCWPGSMGPTDDQQSSAGNVLIAVVKDEDMLHVEEILRYLFNQSTALGVMVSVCGWSLGQAAELVKAVSESTVGELWQGTAFFVDFEWEMVRACYDSQKSSRRERAIEHMRRLSLELPIKWQSLCDWVCGNHVNDEKKFFAQADSEVYQLAGLAGLLIGDGSKLTSIQAERGADIVRTVVSRPELSSILGSLPVCSQVIDSLCSCEARCRAVVGLVTTEELHRAVKPWVCQPMDDWRHGRLLVF